MQGTCPSVGSQTSKSLNEPEINTVPYVHPDQATGDIVVETVDCTVGSGDIGGESNGICLLGLFNSSKVTPFSFVMPTIGASPFLTNSYSPRALCQP